jgi:hypothetical protein
VFFDTTRIQISASPSYAYPKNEAADLTKKQVSQFAKVAKEGSARKQFIGYEA